ncbi:unnamed protein product [Bursaphelenchus xylophilus]|uniref:(pine wood nematode) hypothetical protein n=1 Tax=Bursaphelenchus xylophilus TaxID=6326 RepID=A0A1I7RZJ7_BURXY|nr:unnamed protein product [Bursaphelenchus xylophilus]CAG9111311.1 unnamed protein product [Bursaphelenchus xylophilus]
MKALHFPGNSFLIGTTKSQRSFIFDATTPEITVPDAHCTRRYSTCKKFCNVRKSSDFIAKLSCSADLQGPMCSDVLCQRSSNRCGVRYSRLQSQFYYNKLRIFSQFWSSPNSDDVGVWAEDVISVQPLPGTDGEWRFIRLGTQPLVLKIPVAAFFDTRGMREIGTIGLGRQPKIKNIVQILYENREIPYPAVTISMPKERLGIAQNFYFSFGDYNDKHCTANWESVEAIGDREWMFDGLEAGFLDYQSSRGFRVILTTSDVIHMPKRVMDDFLERGVLAYTSKYSGEFNVYKINDTMAARAFQNYFQITPSLRFDMEMSDILFAREDDYVIQANWIEPNPDNVDWAVGKMILYNNCVVLDYKKNILAFSKNK